MESHSDLKCNTLVDDIATLVLQSCGLGDHYSLRLPIEKPCVRECALGDDRLACLQHDANSPEAHVQDRGDGRDSCAKVMLQNGSLTVNITLGT